MGKQIFINHINAYHGKNLVKFLMESPIIPPNTLFKIYGTIDMSLPTDTCSNTQQLNSNEIVTKIENCDVVIYDITWKKSQIREALFALDHLCNGAVANRNCSKKVFIIISSVITWFDSCNFSNLQTEIDKIYTENDYRSRSCNANAHELLCAEKKTLKYSPVQCNVVTYVVASGITYGENEYFFANLISENLQSCNFVPMYGCGDNCLPTIHVHDLAQIIWKIISTTPRQRYIVAVSNSTNSLCEIIQALHKKSLRSTIKCLPFEDVFLNKKLDQIQVNMLSIDLKFLSVIDDTLKISWKSEKNLTEFFRNSEIKYNKNSWKKLRKIMIVGPPSCGKSKMSQFLACNLNLFHINFNRILKDTSHFVEIAKSILQCSEDNGSQGDADKCINTKFYNELQAISNNLSKEFLKNIEPIFMDILIYYFMQSYMNDVDGFVLDGYPCTMSQAKFLCKDEIFDQQIDGFVLDINNFDRIEHVVYINFSKENHVEYILHNQTCGSYNKYSDLKVIKKEILEGRKPELEDVIAYFKTKEFCQVHEIKSYDCEEIKRLFSELGIGHDEFGGIMIQNFNNYMGKICDSDKNYQLCNPDIRNEFTSITRKYDERNNMLESLRNNALTLHRYLLDHLPLNYKSFNECINQGTDNIEDILKIFIEANLIAN